MNTQGTVEKKEQGKLSELIDPALRRLKSELAELLPELEKLVGSFGDKEGEKTVRELQARVHDPFQFVIVGEIKAGKSSFINALLGAPVCKVDPKPCTDCIQEIVFDEQEEVVSLGVNWKRIGRPIPLLREITIVDTPGTNSLVESHELITSRHIPLSDLVVFVFPAKNPHTGSAWKFLEFVRQEWARKVVFVLQQVDLEPEHLNDQVESVRNYAVQRGLVAPRIFTTSAKWELEGRTAESGFDKVRTFLREEITGGKQAAAKLEAQLTAARKVLQRVQLALQREEELLIKDRELRERIRKRLSLDHERSKRELEAVLKKMRDIFAGLSNDLKKEFRAGMGLGAFMAKSLPFRGGGPGIKAWSEQLLKNFEATLQERVNAVAKIEAGRLTEAVREVTLELLQELKQERSSREMAQTMTAIEQRREEVMNATLERLEALAQDVDRLQGDAAQSAGDLVGAAQVGGVLALIGGLISAVSHVAFLDITGGVLASLAALFVSGVLLFKRRKIVRTFEEGLDEGGRQFEQRLRERLEGLIDAIYKGIERSFHSFFDYIDLAERELAPKAAHYAEAERRLIELEGKVSVMSESRRKSLEST